VILKNAWQASQQAGDKVERESAYAYLEAKILTERMFSA